MAGTTSQALGKSPQQSRSRSLSLRILEAAERVMVRDGRDFTIRAVAAEANTSLGGIYGRFVNRDELLNAVHDHILQRMERQVAQALAAPEITSMAAAVDAFVQAMAAGYAEQSRALSIVFYEALSDRLRARTMQGREVLFQLMLQPAMRFRAEIRRPDVPLAIRTVLHLVLGIFAQRTMMDDDFGGGEQLWTRLCREAAVAAKAYLTVDPSPAEPT